MIEELIALAKDLEQREELNLSEDEVAFYDASRNDSAVAVLGDET